MTYPLSSDVVPGQPTAADHYNNLRADTLRLGQAAADSANVAEILSRSELNLTIQLLGTDRVRVPGSTSAPVVLVVDNYFILRSANNVDLALANRPSGAANTWYLFAVRTPGSTTFTLDVNTSAMESAGRRLIGSFYWNGTAILAPSIRTSWADTINNLINHLQFTGCQGRLSLDPNLPVKDAESGVITLVPYKGSLISLYTPGFGWNTYPIAPAGNNPSINPATIADKVYDVFAYWTGSVVALEVLVWTNLTTRATPLTFQDGCYLKSTDLTRLYLGTFVAFNNSDVKDNNGERGLWNFFNRVTRRFEVLSITASWTYDTAAWRSPNASDKCVRVVVGLSEETTVADIMVPVIGAASVYGTVGIGIDTNSNNSASLYAHGGGNSPGQLIAIARLNAVLIPGCHTLYWVETISGSGTVTFYGYVAAQNQAGLSGQVIG